MKDKTIAIIICVLFLYPCFVLITSGQSGIKNPPYTINVKKNFKNIETLNLSTIGKELSYLPLETSPQCLIKGITKILFSSSFIFVNDAQKRLLQFDRKGKFLRQIGSLGRGPEEFLFVYDFCINEDRNEIYIFGSDNMVVFSFEGKFKRANKLSFPASDAIILDNNSLMFHLPNVSGIKYFNPYSWIITDLQGNPKRKFKNHFMMVGNTGVSHAPIYMFDGSARFMEYGNDTLYYFRDTIKSPYALFSFGALKGNPDPFIDPANPPKNEELNKILIWTIVESEEYLFIKFSRRSGNSLFAVYSKRTDKLTFLKDGVFENDLSGGGEFWPKQIIDNKILVDYVDAFPLLKSSAPKDIKAKLTETSNPVIIFLNDHKN